MSGYGTWPLPRVRSATSDDARRAPRAPRRSRGPSSSGPAGADTATAEQLRQIPAARLAEAVEALHLPVVDGVVVPDEPGILFARGAQHDVPFMTGGDSFDGAVMPWAGIPTDAFLASWGEQPGSTPGALRRRLRGERPARRQPPLRRRPVRDRRTLPGEADGPGLVARVPLLLHLRPGRPALRVAGGAPRLRARPSVRSRRGRRRPGGRPDDASVLAQLRPDREPQRTRAARVAGLRRRRPTSGW